MEKETTIQAIQKLENTMNVRLNKQDEMMQQLIHLVAKNTERIIAMDERFDGVDQRFSEMDERFDGMDQRFNETDERLVRIEAAVTRIEENEPANITSMLNQINVKFDESRSEILALNKRVLKTEIEIERLTKN